MQHKQLLDKLIEKLVAGFAAKELPRLTEREQVSMFHEETIRTPEGTVEVVPAWQWMLTDLLAAGR